MYNAIMIKLMVPETSFSGRSPLVNTTVDVTKQLVIVVGNNPGFYRCTFIKKTYTRVSRPGICLICFRNSS